MLSKKLSILFVSALVTLAAAAQKKMGTDMVYKTYDYTTAKNDPLNARIYKLDNGLTVYLTVNKEAPRIQTYIATRAGSKNDPSDATGLAHYLEHMLFKGTDQYGTKDFAKEKVEIDKIENLYEVYRKTTDSLQRKKIYHQIDSVSGAAAKYAIANEYDKMMSSLGAQGTNAYTSVEQTVYVNDIPSNQLEKWLTIEGERYRHPVMRLFHTELEAVYEEKNRNLDNDGSKSWEAMLAGLFQKHTYGTQTTIGTIDHLKNPSLKKIMEYYNTYYVPNNMAICLSGDLDPDQTIRWIDEKFSPLPMKPVPAFNPPVEDPITKPVVKEVIGPDAETMMLAFRFPGATSPEADMLRIINKILFNGTAGLIDLDLKQTQKVLDAGSFLEPMKDYSAYILSADPKQGQKLEDLTQLLLGELDKIRKGDFPEWLLPAIMANIKLEQTKMYEENWARADAFVEAFITGDDWQHYTDRIDRLSKITKQQVMDFAKKYFTSTNYVVVYKRTGEDKNVKKVIKPAITPVEVNRNDQSEFVKKIMNMSVNDIDPVFIDYTKDIKNLWVRKSIPVYYTENNVNKTFEMFYVFDMGSDNDRKLPVAIQYLPYLGTSKYTPAQVKQEFFKLACNFDVFNSADQVYVSLNGLSENFEKAVQLFEEVLSDCKPNPEALTNLEGDILKKRSDAKLSKNTILWQALVSYGKYGPKNPFTNVLSEAELKALKPDELVNMLHELKTYQHRVLFFGSTPAEEATRVIGTHHLTPDALKPAPAAQKFDELPSDNVVYVANYDMKQAEIIMLTKSDGYDRTIVPQVSLYNEYFGGSMASVVFQDLRESKALAYSCFSSYRTPRKKERSNYLFSYIGAQADKLPEAMAGMKALLDKMPESDVLFTSSKNSLIQSLRTERITRSNILWSYESAKRLGLDYDIRKDIFSKASGMGMADVKAFHGRYISNQKSTVLVLGNKDLLDMKTLAKYGTVKMLSLQDVFGY